MTRLARPVVRPAGRDDGPVNRDAVLTRYASYLATCNGHDWDRLTPFLADTIVVNAVETAEFAISHFDNNGLIPQVEVTADNARLTR